MTYAEFVAAVQKAGPWYVDHLCYIRNHRRRCPLGGAMREPWVALPKPHIAAEVLGIPLVAAQRIVGASDYRYDTRRPLLLTLCGITGVT